MPALTCSHYDWSPGLLVPSSPSAPVPGPTVPVMPPAQPGAQGERWLVAVAEHPSGKPRGVLWDAVIESVSERDRQLGPNAVTVTVPTTPEAMRILGDPIPGTDLFHLRNMIARQLWVGSNRDGRVQWRFVVRDRVRVSGGRVEIPAVGVTGGLSRDRVIGAPTRLNLLGDNRGRFSSGTLAGWRHVGPGSSVVTAGGVGGLPWSASVTGTPGRSWLEAVIRWSDPEDRPWGRQWFAASSYVWLPSGEDLEGYGLVSLAVTDAATGKVWWPSVVEGDTQIGRADSSMPTGRWVTAGPVVGQGLLPAAPYSVDLRVRLHATHNAKATRYSEVQVFRPESTSTVVERDLTRHVGRLWEHGNLGRGKAPTGVSVEYGEECGISEVGTWYHADGQELDEAVEALAGRGIDVWDVPGPGLRVRSAKRRGHVRYDVTVNPWDVLGRVVWEFDPGAQRTSGRATSAAATLWGGSDEGHTDTTWTRGQVIDVVVPAPVGMLPAQLREWIAHEVSELAVLPRTMTLLLPVALARRLTVGDTLRVRVRDGAAADTDWMRVTQMVWNLRRGFAAVDVGTDPAMGAKP